MLEIILYILVLFAGFPAGLILANLCYEEIKNWGNRFKIISLICLILAVLIFFINFEYKIPVIISLLFIIITSLTLVWKGSIKNIKHSKKK